MRLRTVLASLVIACATTQAPRGAAQPPAPRLDWTDYHNFTETTDILKGFADQYTSLTRLTSIGKSVLGRDIWCLEITNHATGAPDTKPAAYIDGNTHAGEISGTEACLYIINHLLTSYPQDAAVKRLVDTTVFYIIPRVNPDGSEAYLAKPGAEDLNGDGIITTMRIRDDRGPLKTSPKDPRLMVPRAIDEKGEWRIIGAEGIARYKQGRPQESAPGGGTVSNRNYPAFWRPEWIQSGAGPYPLSQPEARAQVDFLIGHPNISSVQSFHTHSGVLLRPYCNLPDENVPSGDMQNFEAIGALGARITGYPFIGIYNDFTPDKTQPRYGVFTDFTYDHLGLFTIWTELWKAPGETGRTAFDPRDEYAAMQWNDRELNGSAFIPWQKFNHPQFGEVEIGGWNDNYFTQNPPAKFAEAEWRKNCQFELKRAELLPRLKMTSAKVVPLGERIFRVEATVENEGFLPTSATEIAVVHRLAKPVRVTLQLEGAEPLGGTPTVDLGHIPGNRPAAPSAPGGPGGSGAASQKTVTWVVRLTAPSGSATITAASEKGGTVSTKLAVGDAKTSRH